MAEEEEEERKFPGLACLISGVMSLVIFLIFKKLLPGHFPWILVFLPVFTGVMFVIALLKRKELVLAVIGLLMGIGSVVWFFH